MEAMERAMELTPVLGELGFNERHSFNGLLQVTTDGGPSIGESPQTRGLWYAEAVWVKDGPGVGKVLADMMSDGVSDLDISGIDVARFYPVQKTPTYIHDRCYEAAFKIYNPPVHTPQVQSAGTAQPSPGSHGEQLPPQSMSVSLPLATPSLQFGAWQMPPVHTPL